MSAEFPFKSRGPQWYKLENGVPVKCTVEEWAEWSIGRDRRVVQEDINEAKVSTVFLGLDHRFSFELGPPLLFETMIFEGLHDGYQDRCSTLDEAKEMHKKAVALVRGEITLLKP